MSVILRANELNSILYKYLIESGLTHTAYTLFNEAALSQPLQQFRFDIRPGHLLSILEKGLIYAQIQAHVSLSEYVQCNQPFHLLKSHTCNVVERVKKEKEQFLTQLGDQISDSIKRTNSTYNTAIANKDYDEIVYQAKGAKYFQKFVKIRLPSNQSDKAQQFIVKGNDQTPLLHNFQDFEIDLLRYDGLNDQVVIDQIFPCISEGKLSSPIDFISTGDYLVQLYPHNKITVFKLRNDNLDPIQFTLTSKTEATKLLPNLAIQQLIAITSPKQFWVLNLNTLNLIINQDGFFAWKDYDQYFLIRKNTVRLQTLDGKQLQSFPTDHEWQQISLNQSKNLYALISYKQKLIHISTFENSQPLFIFDLKNEAIFKQILWINSNNVDYFCWLTDIQIKVFDISLNSYSKIIDILEYDKIVTKMSTLKKTDRDQCFLIALGLENIVFYDVTNAKIERIQVSSKNSQLFALSSEKSALIMENCIYFLVGQYIQPLFK